MYQQNKQWELKKLLGSSFQLDMDFKWLIGLQAHNSIRGCSLAMICHLSQLSHSTFPHHIAAEKYFQQYQLGNRYQLCIPVQ